MYVAGQVYEQPGLLRDRKSPCDSA